VELRAGTALACPAAPVPLTITARTPSIVRVEIGPGAAGSATSFLPEQEQAPAPAAAHVAPPKIIDTGILTLELTAEPPGLSFADRPGDLRLRLPLADVRLSPRPQVRLEVVGEQHFYGLGESGQPFDRLGISRRLWNNHVSHGHGSDIAIPLLLSHHGYALFFDNSSLASVDVGRSDGRFWIEYTSEEGPLDLYYLGGANLREVLGEVATLLGRAPMPPRWALGYLQSTRHFEDQDELRRLPEAIREKGLPCDALIFLSTYGEALDGIGASGISSVNRPSCPSQRRSSPNFAGSTSTSSRTSTLCCTRTRRSITRPRGRNTCSTRDTRGWPPGHDRQPFIRRGNGISTSPSARSGNGGGASTGLSVGMAWTAGGSTAEKGRPRGSNCAVGRGRFCTTATI